MNDTCAEFIIRDPRLGDPTVASISRKQFSQVSIAMLQPIRDAMVQRGFPAGEITGGKPWGCGFCVGEGKSRVSIYFAPAPSPKKQRWEGSMIVNSAPPLWRGFLRLQDRAAEKQMVERVARELKSIIPDCPFFTSVRWVSLQDLCTSSGYRDDEKSA